jgi:RimJ/RimL family protein N-acetyltransferase
VIEGEVVRLAPIARDVAQALLDGRAPEGIVFVDGYPSKFSLEVMDILAGPRAATGDGHGFNPCFVVRKSDGVVVGEIGYSLVASTARLGYAIVESCQGRGYASDALRALIANLSHDPRVRRITAETLVGHRASRRVMEKAGMRLCEERIGEVDGELTEVVVYELA